MINLLYPIDVEQLYRFVFKNFTSEIICLSFHSSGMSFSQCCIVTCINFISYEWRALTFIFKLYVITLNVSLTFFISISFWNLKSIFTSRKSRFIIGKLHYILLSFYSLFIHSFLSIVELFSEIVLCWRVVNLHLKLLTVEYVIFTMVLAVYPTPSSFVIEALLLHSNLKDAFHQH